MSTKHDLTKKTSTQKTGKKRKNTNSNTEQNNEVNVSQSLAILASICLEIFQKKDNYEKRQE
ncbi:MAG: hypothetical protein ACXWEY_02715 [Bacteroidia bacterium]